MGRTERRLEARTERRLGIVAPAPVLVGASASRRRRNFGIAGAALIAFVLVFGGTFGSIPVTAPTELPADLIAAVEKAGQEIRALGNGETGGFDDLPDDVVTFAATASGLKDRTPVGSFRAAVRKSAADPWQVALGLIFGGEPVTYNGVIWDSVIVWVGVDPVQTLFATGYRESTVIPSPPAPVVSPSPSPSPSPKPKKP